MTDKKKGVNKKKKSEEEEKELNAKQQKFCLYYLRNFNATQAYIKAYDCNYDTASANGARLLGNARIKKEIDRLRKEQNKRLFLKANDVLDHIIKIAFADLGDFVKWYSKKEYVIGQFGLIKDPITKEYLTQIKSYIELKDSEKVDTSLIQEISQGKDGTKIKLKDNKWAIDYLVKHFDMFSDEWKRKIEEAKLEMLKRNNGFEDNKQPVEFIDDVPEVNSNDCGKDEGKTK